MLPALRQMPLVLPLMPLARLPARLLPMPLPVLLTLRLVLLMPLPAPLLMRRTLLAPLPRAQVTPQRTRPSRN